MLSDFVVCITFLAIDYEVEAAIVSNMMVTGLVNVREEIKIIYPHIEVMIQTGVSSGCTKYVTFLKNYWESKNGWVTQHRFFVWVFQAFDIPWKQVEEFRPYFGWWKFKAGGEPKTVENYVVKVNEKWISKIETEGQHNTEKNHSMEANPNIWLCMEAVAFILIIIAIFTPPFMLWLLFKRFQTRVSKEDVVEFTSGGDSIKERIEIEGVCKSSEIEALIKPHAKSYEIPETDLKIDGHHFLDVVRLGVSIKHT